jgi:hypothetical protein
MIARAFWHVSTSICVCVCVCVCTIKLSNHLNDLTKLCLNIMPLGYTPASHILISSEHQQHNIKRVRL